MPPERILSEIQERFMKSLRIITLLAFVMLAFAISASAQLTGTKNIPGDYADLATAITDLNTQGVGVGGVTFNLLAGNPQTAPAGGYIIGGTGSLVLTTASAANPIVFQGNGNTITASNALTAGVLHDSIFELVGADWVTISGFVMEENPANTTTTAGSNNMTEFGVSLFYVTTTDGAQNNTITGNTIDLNRTYQNTFGIYANATHTSTVITTSATATGAAGGNSGLTITANSITDVNMGIVIVGPTAAADHNDGITIGGTAPNANTLTNFGTTGTFSGYINVSGTVNGILVRNSKNFNISFNSITSSAGGVTSGTLNGIQIPGFSAAATGTFTNNINNNTISLQSGLATGAINGINIPSTTSGTSTLTSTININNNNFTQLNHSVAASGAITGIFNIGSATVGPLNHSISGNTFTNLTVATTGSFTFISNSWTRPTNGIGNINNNSIVTGFNKTGAGGTVLLYTSNSSSGATIQEINNNNNFSNITVTGATTLSGWRSTDGGTPIKTVTGNIFDNWTGGTSALTGLAVSFSGSATISNNTVSNFNCDCTIVGIESSTGNQTVTQNTVHSLTGTGTGTVTGILNSGGITQTYTRNKVYGISNTNAGGAASGLTVSSGTTVSLQNNIIGDISTPNANAAIPLTGINITGGTTVAADFNTVYLNGTSAGALFGSAALNASTSPNLTLRNNIFVNLSTPAGAGETVAYRRTTTTLTTYNAASNNNLFYAGTPSATNLIFTDLTNDDLTLAAYKARVASRDSNSISENPVFVSTTGSNANFLHINLVTPTQIESGGISVAGITLDFDGDTRNATTPDIGADEFTGTPLDLTGPNITYTNFLNTSSTGDRVLSVTVTDPSGVPTMGVGLPVIYYRKNADPPASTQCSFVSGNNYDCSIVAAAVGGVMAGDVISYYVAAQDTANNVSVNPSVGAAGLTANPPAAATPPTTPNTYTIVAAVSGSFNVGTGETYTSLTNAGGIFEYINNNDVTGNITINITTDLTGETGTVALNEFASPFTILIKPSGAPRTITGSINGALIKINGADGVRIDGSTAATFADNVLGGTPALRELTIQNTNTGISSWVIAIQSGTNGANNNIIRNVNILGQDPLTTLGGISIGGNTPGSTAGFQNNGNVVNNCSFRRAIIGIYNAGPAAPVNTGNVISENDMTGTTTERIRRIGILVFNQDGIQIVENNIGGLDSNESADVIGIGVGAQGIDTTTTVSGGVSNALVTRNRINGANSNATAGFSAAGITVAGGTLGANVISNNMITGVISNATSPDFPVGIFVVGATGSITQLYYNSVSMTGDRGATASQMPSYGLAITGTNPTVELKNNIFYTTQTASGGGVSAESYSVGLATATFTNLDSNYNNFWSTGANDGGFRTGSLALAAGTDHTALANWQTAVSDDANSLEVDPSFVDPLLDLHLTGITSPMYDAGTPVSELRDFDNQVRSVVGLAGGVPDIGADEALAPLAAEAVINGRVLTADGRGIRNAIISVSGGNLTQPIFVRTGSFGYYSIEGLDAGQTYVLTINSKRFIFSNPSVVVTLEDNVSEVNFTAEP